MAESRLLVMPVGQLVTEIRERGVRLFVDQGQLRARESRKGCLGPLLPAVAARRAELTRNLTGDGLIADLVRSFWRSAAAGTLGPSNFVDVITLAQARELAEPAGCYRESHPSVSCVSRDVS